MKVQYLHNSRTLRQIGVVRLKDKGLFDGTSCILIMNTYWLHDRPSLVYGLRGVIELDLTVTGATKDLHSGMEHSKSFFMFIDLRRT